MGAGFCSLYIKKFTISRFVISKFESVFILQWSTMNSLESGEARKGSKLKSMWCMTPLQRESQGSAISELKVIKSDFPIVTFGKSNNRPLGSSLNVFQPGEFVIISSATELAIGK